MKRQTDKSEIPRWHNRVTGKHKPYGRSQAVRQIDEVACDAEQTNPMQRRGTRRRRWPLGRVERREIGRRERSEREIWSEIRTWPQQVAAFSSADRQSQREKLMDGQIEGQEKPVACYIQPPPSFIMRPIYLSLFSCFSSLLLSGQDWFCRIRTGVS